MQVMEHGGAAVGSYLYLPRKSTSNKSTHAHTHTRTPILLWYMDFLVSAWQVAEVAVGTLEAPLPVDTSKVGFRADESPDMIPANVPQKAPFFPCTSRYPILWQNPRLLANPT